MTKPLLKIEGLRKEFKARYAGGNSTPAVNAVDLEVYPGEAHGIVGESGSGKTTLARCILRLVEPTDGSIYFDGQDLGLLTSKELRNKRREIQMIFQDAFAALNPAMTVRNIISEPLEIHSFGTPKQIDIRLKELMDAVSLDSTLMDRRPAELSGGQQQRVGIARALAVSPRLLIADEPISSLDMSVQAQILNLLVDLQSRYGLTLILISHSLYAIHYFCTRVSVLYRGRIVEEGPVAQIFHHCRHPYTRFLLKSLPSPDQQQPTYLHFVEADISSPSNLKLSCAFHPRCQQAMAICRNKVPQLKEYRPGERVACFAADEDAGK